MCSVVNKSTLKSTLKPAQPTMPEFEGAMRRVRQHIMAQPTPDLWPSERVGDPRLVPEPYTLAMRYMGKKSEKMKRRKAENGEACNYTARAANCFILFRMHVHQVAVSLFPAETKTLQDKLSARAGELWKELCKDAKEMFAREAKEMERFHKVQFPSYKYKPTKNKRHAAAGGGTTTPLVLKKSSTISNNNNNVNHMKNHNSTSKLMPLLMMDTDLMPYDANETHLDHLTVTIPASSSSLSDYCSPYSSPADIYTSSPSEVMLSPFSAWQVAHMPQLLQPSNSVVGNLEYGNRSPLHSSLPPPTPMELRQETLVHQQQRPSSQPDELTLQERHRQLQQFTYHMDEDEEVDHLMSNRSVRFLKEEPEFDSEANRAFQPLSLTMPDEAELLYNTHSCNDHHTSDPFISSSLTSFKEEMISVQSSPMAQLLIDASAIEQSATSTVDQVDVSWLQALQCVGQGFGGTCLTVSSSWLDAPLPADLIDIPLRNWEQIVAAAE